jgi:hypothetical protein
MVISSGLVRPHLLDTGGQSRFERFYGSAQRKVNAHSILSLWALSKRGLLELFWPSPSSAAHPVESDVPPLAVTKFVQLPFFRHCFRFESAAAHALLELGIDKVSISDSSALA